jgi:hypothetical protein
MQGIPKKSGFGKSRNQGSTDNLISRMVFPIKCSQQGKLARNNPVFIFLR